MRKSAPLADIQKALEKTGYLLEHAVTEAFRKAGWGIISNRYYVDDSDGKARELDLVAYKATKTDDLEIFTTVLISCKKELSNTWAFMSRDRPTQDPNFDWSPVHFWTDVEPLSTYLKTSAWKDRYLEIDNEGCNYSFEVDRDIFAFQVVAPPGEQQGRRLG